MNRLLQKVVYFLWVFEAIGDVQKTTSQDEISISATSTIRTNIPISSPAISPDIATYSATTPGNGTCPSRTLNYITHTLPRQCLRTDRAPYNSTIISPSNGTPIVSPDPGASETTHSASGVTTQVGSTRVPVTLSENASTIGETSEPNLPTTVTASPVTSNIHQVGNPSSPDEDSDSPLDTANFLSFEEWKQQNLAKLGQSPEDVGRHQLVNPNRPRPGINNALESMGEESEIDLDFAGFGGATHSSVRDSHEEASDFEAGESAGLQVGSPAVRSKDAGKTCKERTNYASFDCSATILKSNKECKSASSVLVESKDSYMLNTCSAKNKFIVVQLCNDIQVDTVVLANYEFFSATFRHFRISVSDRYPVEMEKWRDLGTFEGRNTREIQAFLIENPLIWAKYLRIEFLSHYGTEYYCPVTLLRVHGTTMIEDYRHDEDLARGEQVQVTLEAEAIATPPVTQEPLHATDADRKKTVQMILDAVKQGEDLEVHMSTSSTSEPHKTDFERSDGYLDAKGASGATREGPSTAEQIGVYSPSNLNTTCDNPSVDTSSSLEESSIAKNVSTPITSTVTTSISADSLPRDRTSSPDHITNAATDAISASVAQGPSSSPSESSKYTGQDNLSSSVTADNTSSMVISTVSMNSITSMLSGNQSSSSANATRHTASNSLSAQPAQPSNQESFYKSFHKRLQQLESNSTLSLKYIEEQSRILRDAFGKVERRQVSSTTRFLSQLNETVMAELHGFKQAYDQLWQSTVIELEGQRETYQREMLALSSRLTMVADELVWQKRMGIVQSTLLLLCLAMALFGRSADGYLEVPLMQQLAALKGGWESPPDSPSTDSRSPVSLFRRKIWRSKTDPLGDTTNLTDSENSRPQTKEGPDVHVQPPSPLSHAPTSDHDEDYFRGDGSPNVQGKDATTGENSVSPKRSRKKPKKPPNSTQGNGRAKSPLAM